MRVAHESPLEIFDLVQEQTDYDYALVHLFETNKPYLNKFKEAVAKGRHVILDNSLFELETPFDPERFAYWINELKPTEYIIPDALEDSYTTISNLNEWIDLYKDKVSGKTIGVIQGRSYDDLVWCYQQVEPKVDKVAISFDYSWMAPVEGIRSNSIKCLMYMIGRQDLLADLVRDGVINQNKPHHLLGCFLPQEFKEYTKYTWVDTIDTSNPVVHGINHIRYTDSGLEDKVKTKLIEYMDRELTLRQVDDIFYNIRKFREFV